MNAQAHNTTPPRSVLMRLLFRSWEYRHPQVMVPVRLVCGVFNLGLGIALVSYGYWVGAVPLAGAALIFWTAYHLAQSVQGRPAVSIAGNGARTR